MNHYPHDSVVPYKVSDGTKKEQVRTMFDKIAFRYDFMNRFLSLGIDQKWRKKALELLRSDRPRAILDVATGTGDFAIMASGMLKPEKVVGIDISEGMLEVGREKLKKAGLEQAIELRCEDSEAISFEADTFDAATVAFGVRNFEDLEAGLLEIKRVIKPGAKLIVVESTKPNSKMVYPFYKLYMNTVTPGMGKLVSKNKEAYQYLNNSVQKFPEKKEFVNILNKLGYRNAFYKTMTLGVCTIYCAEK
ncbi:MAG: bifunctional demethylmenaquinone methyltransferase/2-methoxy-6-polyprenyl-1,4-benzoquinol methylase UbiE [Chitinophagaceae bacterium]|nr:bifunctional demethylmenaquinone methyltransferase/2-methoxy-6-polyprenyl-1,4-benzoquinol methylase UbiE [Chitinophagaceae bacterium]